MYFKKEFPIIKKITYLDSASSHLKPLSVVNAIKNFYIKLAINPYPDDTPLSIEISNQINNVRKDIAKLVDAKKEEIIFNSGATDGLNNIANMVKNKLKKDDQVIISKYNHDSNILPWLKFAKKDKFKVVVTSNILESINSKTKIIAISQKNNNFMNNINIKEIYKLIKNKNIILINDAAQAISFEPVSLKYCDVIIFSGNKLYGPTGVGVTVIKEKLLKSLEPSKVGSRTIIDIDNNYNYILKEDFNAFESGTPNTAGIIGLGAAIKFFNKNKRFIKKIKKLSLYAHKELSNIPDLKLHSKLGSSIIFFNFKNYSAQDIVSKLAHKYAIYVRGGSFCASLATKNKDMIRISLGIYNNNSDINKIIKILKKEDFLSFT